MKSIRCNTTTNGLDDDDDDDGTEHVDTPEQQAASVAVAGSDNGDSEAAHGCGFDDDTTEHVVITEQHAAAVAVYVSSDVDLFLSVFFVFSYYSLISFTFLAYFFLISKLPNFQISIRTIIPNFQTSKVLT